MQTIGAAIDLRDPCLHERDQLVIEPARLKVFSTPMAATPSGETMDAFSLCAIRQLHLIFR